MSERRRILALASMATLVAAGARAQGDSPDVTAFVSIRDLLRQAPAATVRLAIVAGYAAAGDGGGGFFVWLPADTARADDGLIFSQSGAAGAGRWRRVYEGPIDVRMFGAVGDGKTDDTAAIQAAIHAAAGAEVRIPAGTWVITQTLRFVSPPGHHSAGLKLAGEGTLATIIDSRVAKGPALKIEQAEGYRFGQHGMLRDIEFRGHNAPRGQEQHGIVVSGAWTYRFDRVTVSGFKGNALTVPMVDERAGELGDVEIAAGSTVIHRPAGDFRLRIPGTGAGNHVAGEGLADGTLIDGLVDDRTIRLTKPALRDGRTSIRIWGTNPDGQQSGITAFECRLIFNGGWGIYSNAASGLTLRLYCCEINVNAGGGIRTDGFLDMEGGSCGGNGTDDGKGIGILLDGPGHSPNELARIENVEIDSNQEVSLWIKQARFVRVTRCRFNAHELDKLGRQIPAVAIRLGDSAGSLVHTIELSKNEMRVDGLHMWPHLAFEIPDGANVDDIVVRDTMFWGGWSDKVHTRYRIGKLANPDASLRFEDRGAPVAGFPVRPAYVAQLDTRGSAPLPLPAGQSAIVGFRSVRSSLARPASVWRMVPLANLSIDAGSKQATMAADASVAPGMPLLVPGDAAGQKDAAAASYSRIVALTDPRTLELDRVQDRAKTGIAFAGGLVCPYEGYFAVDVVLDVLATGQPHPIDVVLLVDGKPYRTETSIVHGLGTPQTVKSSVVEKWTAGSAFHVLARSAAGASLHYGSMTVRLLT